MRPPIEDTMHEIIQRLFDHLFWADARVIDLLNESPAARTEQPMRIFAHVLGAERVWYSRIQGDTTAHPVWPSWSLEEMIAAAAANRTDYEKLLERTTAADLDRSIEYTNTQGTAFRTRLSDVLIHVALHGSYHRGQVAAAVRRDGGEPVNTDYITYVRSLPSLEA